MSIHFSLVSFFSSFFLFLFLLLVPFFSFLFFSFADRYSGSGRQQGSVTEHVEDQLHGPPCQRGVV